MTPIDGMNRALQQDARDWSKFTATNYTAALRQMRSPLAQGFLGERIRARDLIAVLNDHELIGAQGGGPYLGENGYRAESPWRFNGKNDYIQLALIADMLRMFTPVSGVSALEVGSYSLKHTAERFLRPHCPYVSNGRLIWAAAALGLPMAGYAHGEGPNVLVGVSEREHDYVSRTVGSGGSKPQADHFCPAAFDYLRAALERAAAGEFVTDAWVQPVRVDEPAPFHDWLLQQLGRDDVVGDLAGDYSAGVRASEHRIARTADDLVAIFHEVSHSPEAYDAVVTSIAEWMRTEPSSTPIRTEAIGSVGHDHGGWGAGAGTVERYDYLCPCGAGTIIEEHDNIPGFREHDVRIDCDKCRTEWRFAEKRSVRDWALVPAAVHAA